VWALRDVGLRELVLEADEENQASLRLAEKSGFERRGTRTEANRGGEERTVAVFVFAG
jgi:RimJ/RimL family protein N-acetyltransferase